ncbi:MAG TPA: Gfo/Idh/MocA family oxidoreductase [Candidatus Baltobacteraceae bacterium]|nr:Gfo/Idh/MocA family oxidoreductase [Candidatus Baltobacteraceae bacterium]
MASSPPLAAPASLARPRRTLGRAAAGVAVVGCGYWGPNLLRNFADNPRAEVRWACDLRAERLEPLSRRYPGVRRTSALDNVLADPEVDLVAIATPVDSHVALARRAIEAGKHVVLEKPLSRRVDEAVGLRDAAAKHGVTIFVDHTFVFTPAVRKMREVVASGELGRRLYYDSVRVNLGLFQQDVSVLWDLAPHDLSILHHLTGGESPRRVSCTGVAHYSELEDVAYLTLFYADDFVAHVHVNWLAPVKVRQILLGGSRKMLVYDDNDPVEKIRIYDKGVAASPSDRATAPQLIQYRLGDMTAPMLPATEALAVEVDSILAALLDGAEPVCGIDAGLSVVRTLNAAQLSLEMGGVPVEIA